MQAVPSPMPSPSTILFSLLFVRQCVLGSANEPPERFLWQSQKPNQADLQAWPTDPGHAAAGKQIHLIVRKRGKRANSTAAPFFYCGELEFERWEGERPITVWWRLRAPLNEELWAMLGPAGG